MSKQITRRNQLQAIGGGILSASIAGCLGGGSGGDGGPTEFTVSTYYSEDFGCRDCINPSPVYDMPERIEEESDGEVIMNLASDGQLSDSTDGGSKAQGNVIQSGDGSFGNMTAFFPELQILLIPYTFPSREAYAHAIYQPEMWENFWVPFAQKYNVLPFFNYVPDLRQIMISEDATEQLDGERLRRPEQLEGLSIRRTESRVAQEVLDTWGANPVEVSWGDTIQGMETGVVDGLETWSATALGFGMGEVVDQVVDLDFKSGWQVQMVNTDWLSSIPEDHMQIIADITRSDTEEMVQMADDVLVNRAGQTDPPTEGSGWDEQDVTVNVLDEDEMALWKDPIDPMENPDMWEPEKELVEELDTPRDDIWEMMYDSARESTAPDSPEDFTLDAWWDDYIYDIN